MAKHDGAEHHKKAAEHHEHAARHHREAAKHHESGAHETAGIMLIWHTATIHTPPNTLKQRPGIKLNNTTTTE